jgi:hypothetical protein
VATEKGENAWPGPGSPNGEYEKGYFCPKGYSFTKVFAGKAFCGVFHIRAIVLVMDFLRLAVGLR